MAKYEDKAHVNVERAAESILDKGGGMDSKNYGDHVHNTVYSRDENRRLSWDEYRDGSVKNVHSSLNGKSYMQYKNND